MFPEPRDAHPDDRSSFDGRDTSASSARSDRSRESYTPSPVAGDDASTPIVIDDADSNASTGTRHAMDTLTPPTQDAPD
eukprot:6060228-Pleurochrysis_carterae.AAC.1